MAFTSSLWEQWLWDISLAPYRRPVLSSAWLDGVLTYTVIIYTKAKLISKHNMLFTHGSFSLLSMSPHCRHHCAPSRPFHQLCSPPQSPGVLAVNSSLPGGYSTQLVTDTRVDSTTPLPPGGTICMPEFCGGTSLSYASLPASLTPRTHFHVDAHLKLCL